MDQIYKVVPGELTIVTGVPNSGKSEWIDALLVNLAVQNGWTFALCSMEKSVRHHARQLLEKYVGKPFFDKAIYSKDKGLRRMSAEELEGGLQVGHLIAQPFIVGLFLPLIPPGFSTPHFELLHPFKP